MCTYRLNKLIVNCKTANVFINSNARDALWYNEDEKHTIFNPLLLDNGQLALKTNYAPNTKVYKIGHFCRAVLEGSIFGD